MKLDLQRPWSDRYISGRLKVIKSGKAEGRAVVTLVDSNGGTRFTTYARYLMAIKLGREVPKEYEVDHVDHDRSNDNVDNLQVLTKEQNRLKELLRQLEKQDCYGVVCPCCSISFLITERQRKMKLAQGVENPFCSRKCAIYYHRNVSGEMPGIQKSSDVIDEIKSLRKEGKTSYQIANQLSISRNTVMKYW